MTDDNMLRPCLWRISSRNEDDSVIYFHCDVHDHNKVSVDPGTRVDI